MNGDTNNTAVTFDVVEDTGSNLALNVSFTQTLARASLNTEHIHLPGSPGIGTKRFGQRTAVCGTNAPMIPPFKGGGSVTRITSLGWVIDRSFTPVAR